MGHANDPALVIFKTMTITYHATLDDAVAPGIVYFLRSKTAKTAKLRSAVSGAITCAIAMVFVFRNEDVGWLSLAGSAGGVIGAALNYFTYEATFRRRFQKSQERELGGRLPAVVVYTVGNGTISCEFLGATTIFSLKDLEEVSDDGERLVISFGTTSLCTIPLRAFQSAGEREEFVAMLNKPSS
jgi:hypothetical protein